MTPNRTNKRLPEFFKVFIPKLSTASLRIPDAWVQHLNALPKNVVLQNRMGKVWHMKMEHANNGVFFVNGWRKFVEECSLEFGDFLIFRYNGDDRFNVKILGKSGCEKSETGPHVGIDIKEEEEEEGHEIIDVNIDFADDHSSDSDASEYNVEEEEEEETEEEASEVTATLKQKGKRICGNDGEGSKKSASVKTRASREPNNVLTREEVRKYVYHQNPYFVSKLSGNNRLFVPSYVLRDFGIQLAEHVTFQDEMERKWPGKVRRWKDGRTWISGWTQVCRWNDVRKDDRCICQFPQAAGRNNTILVHILQGGGSQSQPTNQEPNQADQ